MSKLKDFDPRARIKVNPELEPKPKRKLNYRFKTKIQKAREESEARALVESKFNYLDTYLDHHPRSRAKHLTQSIKEYYSRSGILDRALSILDSNPKTSLSYILYSLAEDLNATRPVLVNGKIEFVRDNATILETKKLILCKIFGLGKPDVHINNIQDQRSITLTLNSKEDINRLENIAQSLSELVIRSEAEEVIQDGEVLSQSQDREPDRDGGAGSGAGSGIDDLNSDELGSESSPGSGAGDGGVGADSPL